MVTISQPSASAPETRFFDIAGNRAKSTLSLYEQRVGYFTTLRSSRNTRRTSAIKRVPPSTRP